MIDNTYVGKTVSFNIFNSSAMGGDVRNAKVIGVMGHEPILRLTEENPRDMHNRILPFLPDPKPGSYTDYLYVVLESANKKYRAIGLPWINGSVTVDQETVFQVTIRGKSLSDENVLRRVLISNDFTQIEITTVP